MVPDKRSLEIRQPVQIRDSNKDLDRQNPKSLGTGVRVSEPTMKHVIDNPPVTAAGVGRTIKTEISGLHKRDD